MREQTIHRLAVVGAVRRHGRPWLGRRVPLLARLLSLVAGAIARFALLAARPAAALAVTRTFPCLPHAGLLAAGRRTVSGLTLLAVSPARVLAAAIGARVRAIPCPLAITSLA